jgi:hypothetical protein
MRPSRGARAQGRPLGKIGLLPKNFDAIKVVRLSAKGCKPENLRLSVDAKSGVQGS